MLGKILSYSFVALVSLSFVYVLFTNPLLALFGGSRYMDVWLPY